MTQHLAKGCSLPTTADEYCLRIRMGTHRRLQCLFPWSEERSPWALAANVRSSPVLATHGKQTHHFPQSSAHLHSDTTRNVITARGWLPPTSVCKLPVAASRTVQHQDVPKGFCLDDLDLLPLGLTAEDHIAESHRVHLAVALRHDGTQAQQPRRPCDAETSTTQLSLLRLCPRHSARPTQPTAVFLMSRGQARTER